MRIARDLIDPDADKVVRRLARHGFQAYLVGGCVRDLLLARTPKDFDVATNATPKEIRQLFRNCRIIGRRFRLAHIFFGAKIIETSTFRANPREGDEVEDGDELLIRRDNVFGTDTEDARRRDFTINGLFYDLEAERVIDHVGGLEDLERRVVRTIGDPDIRFREDPVRMLRAVKFAARLAFEIEQNTLAALIRHRGEIAKCPQPRVLEELYRLLRGGAARRSLALLIDTGLAGILSPHLTRLFGPPPLLTDGESASAAALRAGATGSDEAFGQSLASPGLLHSVARARQGPLPGAGSHRKAFAVDEAAWAAVWAEEEAALGTAADPALSHDHELEDVHDPDEEADVQAELHGLASGTHVAGVPGAEEDEARGYGAATPDAENGQYEDDDDEEDEDEEGEEEDDEEEDYAGVGGGGDRRAPLEDLAASGNEMGREGAEGALLGAGSPLLKAHQSGLLSVARSPEAMAPRRAMAWAMLDQLDIAFRRSVELSNSLLLAALCTPFVFEDLLEGGVRPLEANDVVLEVLHPLAQQLQIARRDAERCRQILLAQRRLAPARRRRGKPMSLVRREFFRDALVIHEMMGQVGGYDVSDLAYWSKLHAKDEGGAAPGAAVAGGPLALGGDDLRPGKKRRRRRGGRRRRRNTPAGQNQGGGEWEPVVDR